MATIDIRDGMDAQNALSETEMFVNALGKTFLCENVEVLEEVCKVVIYLTRQEMV